MKIYRKSYFSASRGLLGAAALALVCALPSADAAAQAKPSPAPQRDGQSAARGKLEKGKWQVKATGGAFQTFTVKANEAKLTEIAGELSKLLKAPVSVGTALQGQTVTLDVSGLAVESVLRLLSPNVYVDYEMGGDLTQPKLLAAYLHGAAEPPPMKSAVIQMGSESVLIEGDTMEGTEEYDKQKEKEEEYLKVTYTNKLLSVVARKQPLSVVLYKIASELGIPFDLRYESNEVVNIDFKNYPLDVAARNLGPTARLYYRADLQTSDILPLRMALVAPPGQRPEGKTF
jgi:hypothetical protein